MLGFSLICIMLLILIISKLNEIKNLLKLKNQAKDVEKKLEEFTEQINSMRDEIGSLTDTLDTTKPRPKKGKYYDTS